jgi:hypothetical protein
MSDPLNIRTLFEDASKEVDRLLPLPGHDFFSDARTMMHDFLNEAKAGGHVVSVEHRAMTVVLPMRDKEKFWIKGPSFDERYSGRQKPPSCDFTIEIRCTDKGVMGMDFSPIGSEGLQALRKYSAKKGWSTVLKNPGNFSEINEAPVQAYIRQIAEQLVYAGRFFEQRAQKKTDISAPGMDGP